MSVEKKEALIEALYEFALRATKETATTREVELLPTVADLLLKLPATISRL